MKTKLLLTAMFAFAVLLQSCIKKGCTDSHANNYVSTATDDDGTCTYDDPAGMVITVLGEECAQQNAIDFSKGTLGCEVCSDDTAQYSADIYFDGTYLRVAKSDSCSGGSLLQIATTEEIQGLGGIYELPSSGFSSSQVSGVEWGYVVRTREGNYARFIIDDYVYDINNIVVGIRIKWQYPMPL